MKGITIMNPYLEHFMALANRGGRGGASGGEARAHRLAKAVCDDVPGIDAKAVSGLLELVRLAAAEPWSARELLED